MFAIQRFESVVVATRTAESNDHCPHSFTENAYLMRAMRIPALIGISVAFCSLSVGCCKDIDTKENAKWVAKPRLSIEPEAQSDCHPIHNEAEAVNLALSRLPCSNAAIDALKSFADRNPDAMNDLAAVHYIRADYLNAFEAARHAVLSTPQPRDARFNLALAEEALGLTTDAAAVWPAFHKNSENEEWSRRQLDDALRAGNREAVSRLIKPHPSTGYRILLDLLRDGQNAEARLLARELTSVTGDRYPMEAVKATSSEIRGAYHDITGLRGVGMRPGSAQCVDVTRRAAEQLLRAGSPVAYTANAMNAFCRSDLTALEKLQYDAQTRGYSSLVAFALTLRGYLLLYHSRYLESLNCYEAARQTYLRMHDPEGALGAATTRLGELRILGDTDQAWTETVRACADAPYLTDVQTKQRLYGEAAATAFALGHAEVSLLYSNEAIRSARETQNPAYIAIACRRRAAYEVSTGRYHDASLDLARAKRLNENSDNPALRNAVDARIAEVEAQSSLHTDLDSSISAYTRAIDLSKDFEYSSFRASLFAERAEAERQAHRENDAEKDLRESLQILNDEEQTLMKERSRATDEIAWTSYFSRFQDTYRALIRQLIETGRSDEAFIYADRARAFEPLNLEMKITAQTLPGKIELRAVQRVLSPNDFVIEYTVLEDRTYAWVIGADRSRSIKLDTGKADIARWNETLRHAVPAGDLDAIDATLLAAYDKLLAAPMSVIAQMGHASNIVIVPDGAMYGIPFCALHDPTSRRYLIEDVAVSTAPSAALYALAVRTDATMPRDQSALLIGNPATSLADLRYADQEVKEISNLYAPAATVRTGVNATPSEFIRGIGVYGIVHVAAHGVVNEQSPSHSSLRFAATENDSGALDAAHLLSTLKPGYTRLVVLAACNSAGGTPVGAEGVSPLVRPLIVNGVPAVIGTLWDVNDATAMPLLVSFHQHYRKGDDAAVALQKAQIELLRKDNSGLQSVLAWAPFQVIGHGSSPFAAAR